MSVTIDSPTSFTSTTNTGISREVLTPGESYQLTAEYTAASCVIRDGVGGTILLSGSGSVDFTAVTKILYINNITAGQVVFTELHLEEDGGSGFDFYTSAPGVVSFNDGSNVRVSATDIEGGRVLALNFTDGGVPEAYLNGVKGGAFDGVSTVSDSLLSLLVGNDYDGGDQFKSTLQAAFYISRTLNPEEQKSLYQELLEPDFNEAAPYQEGDVNFFDNLDGGQMAVENGFTEMTGRMAVAVYLSLFGGAMDDAGGDDLTKTWWGNLDEPLEIHKYRSKTQYLLKSIPLTSGNLVLIQRAVLSDLQWILDVDAANELTAEVTIPGIDKANIKVDIVANGKKETFNFTANWEASQ